MKHHNFIKIFLLLFLFLVSGLAACGTSDGRKVISASDANRGFLAYSVEDATARLGSPDSRVVQGDGLVRHSWVYRNEIYTPEREVSMIFSREHSFFSDRVRVIPEKTVIEYCFFNIFTDADGVMKDITQEGNACHLLLQSRQAGHRVNSIPQTE